MAKLFDYIPDKCKNCEFLGMSLLQTCEKSDNLPPDSELLVGDHRYSMVQVDAAMMSLLGLVEVLCPGTNTPEVERLQPCNLNNTRD